MEDDAGERAETRRLGRRALARGGLGTILAGRQPAIARGFAAAGFSSAFESIRMP